MQLLPAPRGQLELVAARNLRADNNGVSILLSDSRSGQHPGRPRPDPGSLDRRRGICLRGDSRG